MSKIGKIRQHLIMVHEVPFGLKNTVSGFAQALHVKVAAYTMNSPTSSLYDIVMYWKYFGAKSMKDCTSNLDICFNTNRSSLVLQNAEPDFPPRAIQ
jgi:hypothetical protein